MPFDRAAGAAGQAWRRVVDTALASPLDIVGLDEGPRVRTESSVSRWRRIR